MKLHHGQLPKTCGQKGLDKVPAWVPPAWKIPLIDERRKRPPVEDRPQLEIELPMVPPDWKPPERKAPDEVERGVCEIQL
jgi:hypothetical protein